MAFIEAQDVVKDYSGHRALDGLSLSVPEGCVYGLLGPNGAGKTTFIRILNQITRPDSGTVLLNGHKLRPDDVYGIGYMPEERGLYKKMKVGEEAVYLARLKGLSRADAETRLKQWFEKFEISAWWNKKVEELSKGMQQKVQFIVTVLHEPKLLIFDEPFSGFDPVNANLLKREILELKQKGSTVIFSTHNMASVEEVCDNITLINSSKDVLSGSVWDVKQQYKDNTFAIRFSGSPDALTAPDSNIVVSDLKSQGMYTEALVHPADASISANDLIRLLLGKVELVSFEECLPSMNDIFIHIVEGQKTQTTSSQSASTDSNASHE
ncbi:MAG: ATP-binding cassette domain-containing protein [Bacteroidales bacterium]|nr:ATP-binding cassette domain-containing protein [Bacteroidales bacterium]